MVVKTLIENGVLDAMMMEVTNQIDKCVCKWPFGEHIVERGVG